MRRIIITFCTFLTVCSFFNPVQAQEKSSLTLWSHWANSPIKINFMTELAEAFQEQYNIEVNITWMSKNVLKKKAEFVLEQGEVDLVYVDYEFNHPRLWRSLENLSDLELSGKKAPGWRLGSIGESTDNFLPIEGASQAIYFNKALFKKAGIVIPENTPVSEKAFLTIIHKLREKGITPIGEGAFDREWKAGIPIVNTIFRYAGPVKMKQLLKGEINFADPDVVKGLKFWKQVIDAQAYDPQKAFRFTLAEGIHEVTDAKAAISFCGTWIKSKYGGTERDKDQLGVMDWFSVEGGKGNGYYEMTWPAGYGINRHSSQIASARKFLKFLMTPLAASLWMKHVQSPYPIITEELPTHSLYAELLRQRKGKQPVNMEFSVPTFSSKAANNMWSLAVKEFILGNSTVDEFVKRMNNRL